MRADWRWVVAGALAMILAAACGGGSDDGPTPSATPTVSAADRAAALCANAREVGDAPVVAMPEAVEISGIAASTQNAGIIWAHNDSGDRARVLAFDATGRSRGVWVVEGAEAIDWEDMAAGRRSGTDDSAYYLYSADIGDNDRQRSEVTVYRVLEPVVGEGDAGGNIAGAEAITLRYPDGAHDAETLLIDPRSGGLAIVTKELLAGEAGVYVASNAQLVGGSATLTRAGSISHDLLRPTHQMPDDAPLLARAAGFLPTGGDVSRDGGLITIRTYGAVWIWGRDDGQTLAQALAGVPCEAPSALEAQGEAVSFDETGDGYFTVSEGSGPALHHFTKE